LIPAFVALISGIMILAGTTLLKRIPISVKIPTLTPDANEDIHNPTGTKLKNKISTSATNPIITTGPTTIKLLPLFYFYLLKKQCML
jgi:hypothetical protein